MENPDCLTVEIKCVIEDRNLLDYHHNTFDAETMEEIANMINDRQWRSLYGDGRGEHESLSESEDGNSFLLKRCYQSPSKVQDGKRWYVCLDCGHRFYEEGHCVMGATCYCTRRHRGNTQPYPSLEECEIEHYGVEIERNQFCAMSKQDHIALYPGLKLAEE